MAVQKCGISSWKCRDIWTVEVREREPIFQNALIIDPPNRRSIGWILLTSHRPRTLNHVHVSNNSKHNPLWSSSASPTRYNCGDWTCNQGTGKNTGGQRENMRIYPTRGKGQCPSSLACRIVCPHKISSSAGPCVVHLIQTKYQFVVVIRITSNSWLMFLIKRRIWRAWRIFMHCVVLCRPFVGHLYLQRTSNTDHRVMRLTSRNFQ